MDNRHTGASDVEEERHTLDYANASGMGDEGEAIEQWLRLCKAVGYCIKHLTNRASSLLRDAAQDLEDDRNMVKQCLRICEAAYEYSTSQEPPQLQRFPEGSQGSADTNSLFQQALNPHIRSMDSRGNAFYRKTFKEELIAEGSQVVVDTPNHEVRFHGQHGRARQLVGLGATKEELRDLVDRQYR
ncbi:uncharacterized protein N7484_008212 [Penicillium longicatenatum]|uniref:uncharacterized protein n=1 Tax=Penicillium longicatenatum TaxID=1561947 RepID=UPI0025479EDE|nr:uncharacterized protein N7484_008212 [Penicillium longicatenatum]KAJ5640350.1 hypothetical protein N7484_008212 [Penicillium longicatenatum]